MNSTPVSLFLTKPLPLLVSKDLGQLAQVLQRTLLVSNTKQGCAQGCKSGSYVHKWVLIP